ncbi:MAG: phosphatidylglycerophosphatase A [Acidobacteria bacterium]|nr:MAG: phosphatidylglycerophosphatase A [Acidobacteriota bacterium]
MRRKSSAAQKRRVALAIATALGLGYFPKAPGTFGSLAGILLSWILLKLWPHTSLWEAVPRLVNLPIPYIVPAIAATLSIGLVGLWAASRASDCLAAKDPQIVVVDEVSGQLLATLFTFGSTERYLDGMTNFRDGFWWRGDPNWKYLVAGFILFRVFDIWKPFPARRAELLPGGLGIMADDWVAGAYAALGLWLIRALRF